MTTMSRERSSSRGGAQRQVYPPAIHRYPGRVEKRGDSHRAARKGAGRRDHVRRLVDRGFHPHRGVRYVLETRLQHLCRLPVADQEDGTTARLICDVYKPNGEPFEGDPRYVLKRVLAEAAELGFTVNAGPEAEFFLFRRDAEGRATTITHDAGGYFDLGPIERGEDVRRDIVTALDEMGFRVEASHHEVAMGQHEIDFQYDDALTYRRPADHV